MSVTFAGAMIESQPFKFKENASVLLRIEERVKHK